MVHLWVAAGHPFPHKGFLLCFNLKKSVFVSFTFSTLNDTFGAHRDILILRGARPKKGYFLVKNLQKQLKNATLPVSVQNKIRL